MRLGPIFKRRGRPFRILGVIAVAAAAITVGLQVASSHSATSVVLNSPGAGAAADPTPCAEGDVLLQLTLIDPAMERTSQMSEQAPPQNLHVAPPLNSEWFQAQDGAVRGLPANFGPRNASELVSKDPSRLFQAIETVQTFVSGDDASTFLQKFRPDGMTVPQVPVPGVFDPQPVRIATDTPALGDEALMIEQSLPEANIPVDVQYVIRHGSTVITLELIGGLDVTPSSTLRLAQAALDTVVAACG
jgi:hypothetical protein